MRRVVLHIDRLALHGLDADQARAVAEALQVRLSALLADPAAPLASMRLEAVPRLKVTTAPAPEALGHAAAGAVAQALGAGKAGGER